MTKLIIATTILSATLSSTVPAMAQEASDTTEVHELHEVVVESALQTTDAHRTVYIPTSRQKHASQTGAELIEQLGIPQLSVSPQGGISTSSGKSVAVFIDFLPATADDLKAMRLSDVRRVEYYEYPSDPRLQGNQFVVNYVMARYDYGGYVKGYGHANILHPSGQLLGHGRFQYKRMTYDLMGYGWGHNSSHYGSELHETYRLPQSDGTLRVFDRYSRTTSSDRKSRQYFAAFQATYNTDSIQASTQINASKNRTPVSDQSGEVFYSPADFPASAYTQTSHGSSHFVSVNGYYFFSLPGKNSITFTPSYIYSHTERASAYTEGDLAPLVNGAVDNTNQLEGKLKFNHDFGKYGQLLGFVEGTYEYNRTRYTGTADALDRAKATRIGAGATYSLTIGQFYGSTGFGWNWDRQQFGDLTEKSSTPWFDLSLQYGFREKHSMSLSLHHATWAPSSDSKSPNIIQSTPVLSYTGNPHLVPARTFDLDLRYTWLPGNNYSLNAYAYAWMVDNRYAFDYEASSTGVVRTIRQPMGTFAQGKFGVSATLRFLDRKLVFSANIGQVFNHNGRPYNVDHTHIDWYARVLYYLGKWNFGITYISPSASPDGWMNGVWVSDKSDWYVSAGWSNKTWTLRANVMNMTRWNWRSARLQMSSRYYDTLQQQYNGQSHALISLSATCTFGFGKEVRESDEPSVRRSASSGILQ